MFPTSTKSDSWNDLEPLDKLENLNKRLKLIESNKGTGMGGSILGPISGSTLGQAEDHVKDPIIDNRLRLVKSASGNWVIPNNSQVYGGRYVSLPDGSHFDLYNDVDINGYVSLH